MMELESKRLSPLLPPMMMVVVVLCIIFQSYFSKALAASSIVFPVNKNTYTGRAYFTDIKIGRPHKSFELHIDSGSDLTWVQCDGPCEDGDCNVDREHLYKPPEDSIVKCKNSLCAALHGDDHDCPNPTSRCEYELDFGDEKITKGYLVKDYFPLRLLDGSVIHPHLVFGCGYKQTGVFKGNGVLGLGMGEVSLSSQLHSKGLIHKVVGHCLSSGEGGGFLFLGNHLIPPSTISWTQLIDNYEGNYLSGQVVDLLFDGEETQVKEIQFDFDSGHGVSYLKHAAYEHTLVLIDQVLVGKPLISAPPVEDFPKCWKHEQHPIESLDDVTPFFKKLALKFSGPSNIMLELPPKNYLVFVEERVCLGILDGEKSENLENPNVIGVNFMQDKLVIYDDVNSRIGWTPSRSCHSSPMT